MSCSTWNLRLKSLPPFEKRRLRPMSAYNVWIVRASENVRLSRIGSRPCAFQSAYVTLNSPRGGSKSKFVVFVHKIQLQSNKVCYQVSLCENFQRQSCIRTRWRFGVVGSDVGQINKVTLRRARLVLGWVTVSGFNSWCGKFVSV